MPVNHYFKEFKHGSEQQFWESHVIESIKVMGQDFVYMPRDLVKLDDVFNEDTLAEFKKFYTVEMYLKTVNGFGGQGDLISKFGLKINDSAELVVSRKRFTQITKKNRPFEGDLIYFPMTNGIFEIKFVEDEDPFFQLGKRYVFRLDIELFKASQEKVETGHEVVDKFFEERKTDVTTANDPFAKNEQIETEENDKVRDFSETSPFGNS